MIDSPFVYLAQTNPVACDLEGNAKQILDAAKTAHELYLRDACHVAHRMAA